MLKRRFSRMNKGEGKEAYGGERKEEREREGGKE